MKKEFTVLQEEKDKIMKLLTNNIIVGDVATGIMLGGHNPLKEYWKELGKKYGFDPDTVEPAKGDLSLLAMEINNAEI